MFKEKENTGLKGGFNLLDTYPLRFCNIIEKISSDTTPETFEFPFPDQEIRHIIVNLCPTEPWALPNWVILGHQTTAFLNKLKEIKTRLFPEARCYIAINERENESVKDAIIYKTNEPWIEIFRLHPKYPHNDPVVLAKVILGMDINFNQDTTPQGILFLDAQTVLAICERHMLENKVNSRFIALSGTGLKENEIVHVHLGTSVEKILRNRVKDGCKCRVFINGPMRGMEITDLSRKTDWTVNNIVVLDAYDRKAMFPMFKAGEMTLTTNMLGEQRRCIYCNFCDDICPVGLEPALYYHSYSRGEKHNAILYNPGKCIECGLCSFICPSKLELLQIIKECKETIGRKPTE